MNLQESYIQVKNHPYLLGFEPKYSHNFYQALSELESAAYNVFWKFNKNTDEDTLITYYEHTWFPMLDLYTHDVNRDLSYIISNNYTPNNCDKFNFGSFIIRLNNIISICHAYIENREITILPSGNEHCMHTMEKCDNGYYRRVYVGDERLFEHLIQFYKKEIEKWLKHIENSYDSKWEQTCLKSDQIMLKDLEEKTGIFYKIKQK